MAIIRNRSQNRYTNISNNILRNQELSLRDRGLLVTLLSLPDNWKFSVAGLAEILKSDGKHTIRAGLNNLENMGYLVRRQTKTENGKFSVCEWEILEEPELKEPLSDFLTTEKPMTEKLMSENQTQYNTNISNTNKSNTNQSIMNQSSEDEKYKMKWGFSSIEKVLDKRIADACIFREICASVPEERSAIPLETEHYSVC